MERVWMKIGEAARRVGVNPKDLRYWESIIPEIQPRRSLGNLRYYHVDELDRLKRIHAWIREGFTVSDCRELLRTGQVARGLGLEFELEAAPEGEGGEPRPLPIPRPRRAPRGPSLAPVRRALETLLSQLERRDEITPGT